MILVMICLMLGLHFNTITPSSGLHRKTLRPWPGSIVYFDIDPSLPKDLKEVIKYAVQYLSSLTCLRCRQRYPWRDDVPNYVTFNYYNDTGTRPTCHADLGFVGGRQEVRLGRECWRLRYLQRYRMKTVVHEMMHSLGFHHEHQRPDRDCYVKVIYGLVLAPDLQKVQPFDKWVDDFPYDHHSITHYGPGLGIEPLNQECRERLEALEDNLHGVSGGVIVDGDLNARAVEWGNPLEEI